MVGELHPGSELRHVGRGEAGGKARAFALVAPTSGPQQAGQGGGETLAQLDHGDVVGDNQAMKQCPGHLGSGHQEVCWAVCVKGGR